MAKTLMFTVLSVKGGVGKTVTAVHVAAALNEIGTTLLVDGDATRSASLWAQRLAVEILRCRVDRYLKPFPAGEARSLRPVLNRHWRKPFLNPRCCSIKSRRGHGGFPWAQKERAAAGAQGDAFSIFDY